MYKYSWVPYKTPKLTRLINEIVLEEESDLIDDAPTSHFMYYYHSIKSMGIKTDHIHKFITDLHNQLHYNELINQSYLPKAAKTFMDSTYEVLQQSVLEVAATFAFGRESLVPSLFIPIVEQLSQTNNDQLSPFITYLKRHIELDGEFHAQLAFNLVSELALTDQDWKKVKTSAQQSLKSRLKFWDDILSVL